MFRFAHPDSRLIPAMSAAFMFGFLCCTVQAQDAPATDSVRNFHVIKDVKGSKEQFAEAMPRHVVPQATQATQAPQAHESPLARAIARSAKKGFIESGVEASAQALIDCQQETSSLYAMPFGSSEAQRAHCQRF